MRSVVVVAALLAPAPALAYECTAVEVDPDIPLAWPTRTLPYAVSELSGLSFADVEAAFSVWEDVPCSDVAFSFQEVVPADATGGIILTSVTEGWDDGASDTVALTTLQYRLDNGRIITARIELNVQHFTLADALSETCDGEGRLHDHRSVLTHEIGHMLGLSHTSNYSGASTDPTMAPRVEPCDASKRDLEADDVAAICALYPVGERGVCHGREVLAQGPDAASGCATTGGRADFAVLVVLLFGLKTCRKTRSGG